MDNRKLLKEYEEREKNTRLVLEHFINKLNQAVLFISDGLSISWKIYPTKDEAQKALKERVKNFYDFTQTHQYSWVNDMDAYLCPLDTDVINDQCFQIIVVNDF